MSIGTRCVFNAGMDIYPDKESPFNEVYDTGHGPCPLEVPGATAVARLETRDFEHGRAARE